MITDLHLSGGLLMTYAIIYQFSQGKAGIYTGGPKYLQEWMGCSKPTALKYLKSLVEAGLVEQESGTHNGVQFCHYRVKKFYSEGVKKFDGGSKEIIPGGGKEILPHNKDIKNKDKFIPPTPQEVSAYAKERGFVSPEGFAAHFIDFYTQAEKPWHLSNGKPMKDWKRSVITWEPSNKNRIFPEPNTPRVMSAAAFTQQFR